jgi:hypothetical protein
MEAALFTVGLETSIWPTSGHNQCVHFSECPLTPNLLDDQDRTLPKLAVLTGNMWREISACRLVGTSGISRADFEWMRIRYERDLNDE